MKKIFVIGSATMDMVVKAEKHPLPGETLLGGNFFMNAGGKGANQAVAVARLGGNLTFVAKVGNDVFGKQIIEGFRKENMNTDFVFVDEKNPSGAALIMVNATGENCIVVAPGSNGNLLMSDIDKVKNISEAEIILMQLEIPMDTIQTVARNAKSNNQKVILNPAPAQHLSDELLNGLFLVTPNETEAAILTGIEVTDDASAESAANYLLNKGVENVIITLGKQGAYFKNKGRSLKIKSPEVIALDTTAAGDTFSGALTVALTEGMDWKHAIEFACKAASISVTRLGAQASVPYRKEIV
ncbi:MAG: ribokinase [Bacteroidota bacterium]|nr:ribokinase [Bacteroidota bacterium]